MKVQLVILFLLLSVNVTANEEILFARNAISNIDITDTISIIRQGDFSEVRYVDANLSWYPKNTLRQEILDQTFTPIADFEDDIAKFRWLNPQHDVTYTVNSRVLTNSDYFVIDKLVSFPIKNLDEELIPYTLEREIIDSNQEIRDTAAAIASGKKDLFEVVYSLAEFTRQTVEYNLTTVNIDASQKASWVFENKRGVCDELTSLFISLVRSLGIPAKFVSGVSYSNLESFDEPWQAHGWSEVYFPEFGWIPFDITYGEYAYLDASHIKLKEDFDAGNRAASYSGKGKAFSFGEGNFDIDVTVEETSGRQAPGVQVFIEPVFDLVGIGSYNIFRVDIINLQEYYVADKLRFSSVDGLELFLPESDMIMLRPLERKQLMILAKVDSDLSNGFNYAFPQQLETDRGVKAGTSFRVEANAKFIDKITAESYLNEETKSFGFGKIKCESDKSIVYLNDQVLITCSTAQDGVVCFNDDCQAVKREFEYNASELGFKTLQADLYSSGSLVGSSFFPIEVLAEASLKIEDFGINQTIEYGGLVPVKFKFSTIGRIKHLSLELQHKNFVYEQEMNNINEGTHEYTFMIDTSNLAPGNNLINFHFEYNDFSDTFAVSDQEVYFVMNNAPWYQHIRSYLMQVSRKLFN